MKNPHATPKKKSKSNANTHVVENHPNMLSPPSVKKPDIKSASKKRKQITCDDCQKANAKKKSKKDSTSSCLVIKPLRGKQQSIASFMSKSNKFICVEPGSTLLH